MKYVLKNYFDLLSACFLYDFGNSWLKTNHLTILGTTRIYFFALTALVSTDAAALLVLFVF